MQTILKTAAALLLLGAFSVAHAASKSEYYFAVVVTPEADKQIKRGEIMMNCFRTKDGERKRRWSKVAKKPSANDTIGHRCIDGMVRVYLAPNGPNSRGWAPLTNLEPCNGLGKIRFATVAPDASAENGLAVASECRGNDRDYFTVLQAREVSHHFDGKIKMRCHTKDGNKVWWTKNVPASIHAEDRPQDCYKGYVAIWLDPDGDEGNAAWRKLEQLKPCKGSHARTSTSWVWTEPGTEGDMSAIKSGEGGPTRCMSGNDHKRFASMSPVQVRLFKEHYATCHNSEAGCGINVEELCEDPYCESVIKRRGKPGNPQSINPPNNANPDAANPEPENSRPASPEPSPAPTPNPVDRQYQSILNSVSDADYDKKHYFSVLLDRSASRYFKGKIKATCRSLRDKKSRWTKNALSSVEARVKGNECRGGYIQIAVDPDGNRGKAPWQTLELVPPCDDKMQVVWVKSEQRNSSLSAHHLSKRTGRQSSSGAPVPADDISRLEVLASCHSRTDHYDLPPSPSEMTQSNNGEPCELPNCGAVVTKPRHFFSVLLAPEVAPHFGGGKAKISCRSKGNKRLWKGDSRTVPASVKPTSWGHICTGDHLRVFIDPDGPKKHRASWVPLGKLQPCPYMRMRATQGDGTYGMRFAWITAEAGKEDDISALKLDATCLPHKDHRRLPPISSD